MSFRSRRSFANRSLIIVMQTSCALMGILDAPQVFADSGEAPKHYSIESQDVEAALRAFAVASDRDIVFASDTVAGKTAPGIDETLSEEDALRKLLRGTGLEFDRTVSGGFVVRSSNDPKKGPKPIRTAAAEPAGGTVSRRAAAAVAETGTAASRIEQPAPGLEEIVVTARKRDERLIDVPVAVSVLSSEQIERYATSSLTSIGEQIPQLIIGETLQQVGGSIDLRGIGAGTSNPSTEQAVTINLDGVQASYGNAVRLGQFDLQRVEVLKGPQALFFGKNSPGGIVSLVSNDPGDHFEAQVRTGYEADAEQKFFEGIISGPLTDTIGGRLVGYFSNENGWFRNYGTAIPDLTPGPAAPSDNSEEGFVRGTLAYRSPNGHLRVKLKINYSDRERHGIGPSWIAQLVYCPTGAAQNSGGLTTDCRLNRDFTDVALSPAAGALDPALGDGVPFMSTKQSLGSLSADYDLSDVLTLTSVSGFYRIDDDAVDSFTFSSVPSVGTTNDLHTVSSSEELRLASSFQGPLNFLIGGFYQYGYFTERQPIAINFGAPFLLPIEYYQQDTHAYSYFGQLRYKLTDQIELSAGGRESHEGKALRGTVNNTPFSTLVPSRDFNNFSPELTATYKPTRDFTAYISYRQGFTSGGFNTAPMTLRSPAFPTLAPLDLSFAQTTVKGEEGGVKGYLADRQMQFDLTVYYYKYSELQLSKWDAAAFAQETQNAGGADVRGVEFNTTLAPNAAPGLELRGAAGFNEASYTDFIGGCYTGQSIAAGCNLLPTNAALAPATYGTAANPYTSQNQSGQPLARAPKFSLNGGATYDHKLGSGALGASMSVDATYSSSFIFQTEANPLARQGGYWGLNGNISLYRASDRAWQVALIGRNLTNKLVAITGSVPPFSGGGTGTAATQPSDLIGTVSPPRSILLELTMKSSLFGG